MDNVVLYGLYNGQRIAVAVDSEGKIITSGSGGSGTGFTAAVIDYAALPAPNTASGKYYYVTTTTGGYPIGVYYSDGTNWIYNTSYPITVVANYSALPAASTVSGKFYWCSSSQGTAWLPGSLGGTYYNSGMYYSNGTTWEFLNTPYQSTQAQVNTGTNNDTFVTPQTFANASKWNTKQDTITILPSVNGGTGVNNGTNTITIGGNLTFSGAFTTTFTATGNTSVTLPTSGTLMANPMTTLGDTIYGAASGVPTRIPVGTRGTIYQVGASSVPQWNSNILDSNGNTILAFSPTGSAVNSFTISNATGTNAPILSTPNSGAGTDQLGIGATINLGLGTSAGQSGIFSITTGQITSTGTTVQTRYNLFQIGSLGTTSSGFILNSNGGTGTLANNANGYTMQQTNTSLLINNINTNQTVNIRINNGDILACALGQSIFSTGLSITKATQSSSWFTALTVNGGADTNKTAATEFFMVNFNMAQTKTWLAGTVATQREVVFQAPTYAGASATAIFTTAATVAITGAPIQGSNASIAQPLSFWVQGGTSRFDGIINLNPTYTAAGTTGNQTINRPSGSIRIAAAGTSVVLTNSFITTNSRVIAQVTTNDTTAFAVKSVIAAGSVTFTLNAAATAEVEIAWFVLNN